MDKLTSEMDKLIIATNQLHSKICLFALKNSSEKKEINEEAIIKIQSHFKRRLQQRKYNLQQMNEMKNYFNHYLDSSKLQEMSNYFHSLKLFCEGDGCGLLGGALSDMIFVSYLKKHLPDFFEHHCGESDCKIKNTSYSLKKINGKSMIALNWSKNDTKTKHKLFQSNIIIVNLKSSKWWKKEPKNKIFNDIVFNETIPSGIYFIDKYYCQQNIKVSSNNKTDTLIKDQYLYAMLLNSMKNNLYIKLPIHNNVMKFSILNAFN